VPMIDVRSAISMELSSEILLKIAQDPLSFENLISKSIPEDPGGETTRIAAALARQASCSVISNCVMELWSTTVKSLLAIEPDFPLYPKNVIKFVEDSRLRFLFLL
jgi:hypothetical protein